MKVNFPFNNLIIPDDYAKNAQVTEFGMAVTSFPFSIEELPNGTKSLAWTLIDYDAVPVCGFPYIHWLVANVKTDQCTIARNFSLENKEHLEGKNSLVSNFFSAEVKTIDQQYIGPKPPDKDHDYHLVVYALDSVLELENGFYLNHLMNAIEGHILDSQKVKLLGEY